MKIQKLLIAIIPAVIFGCTKPPVYPPEPQIDLQYVLVADTTDTSELHNRIILYQLVFKVLDGDGDIGLKQSDTTAPYTDSLKNNLFISLLKSDNGTYDTVDMPIALNYRIPYADPIGLNEYYKATVYIDMNFPKDIMEESFDTIKFSFYILDRAFHKSNVQTTPPIPIDFRGKIIDTDTLIRD